MSLRPRRVQIALAIFAALVFTAIFSVWAPKRLGDRPLPAAAKLRVLTYSSFMNTWGPGPELAAKFRLMSGVEIEFIDSGDAGLLLEKLRLFPSDVVIGFDRLSLKRAGERVEWRALPEDLFTGAADVQITGDRKFVPFDWAPIAFVYRDGEIAGPTSLQDLTDSRFAKAIALEDPRTSTPGELFLFWVLDEFGVDKGFEFLEKLKPNIALVAGGWSGAYGAFTKGQAKTVLSYLTSPIYHEIEEKDSRYRAAEFAGGQPLSIEYAAIPVATEHPNEAEAFMRFLVSEEAQRLIMQKNYMLPVLRSARSGAFTRFTDIKPREIQTLDSLLAQRAELMERWRKLGL